MVVGARPSLPFKHKGRLGEDWFVGLNWRRALVLRRLRFFFNDRGIFVSLNGHLYVGFLID